MKRLVSVMATTRKVRFGFLEICETKISMDYDKGDGALPDEEADALEARPLKALLEVTAADVDDFPLLALPGILDVYE